MTYKLKFWKRLPIAFFFLFVCLFSGLAFSQNPLFTGIPVSDIGVNNNIGKANTSRNIATDQLGNIYVVFTGSEGIRVAKSTNRGERFLSSILVANFNSEPEIAINSQGIIFVSWVEGTNIKLSRSEDQGASFSTGISIGSASISQIALEQFETVHIATFDSNVYISDRAGENIYINTNNGIGNFTNIKLPNFAYSDVLTDLNGIVYAPRDNPTLDLFQSTDNGNSFNQKVLDPANAVYFSSYTLSDGPCGTFIFVAGSDSTGYKIDLTDGTTSQILFGNNGVTSHARTLFADSQGTIIDGYQNISGELVMSVSFNQGETFNTPIVIANGSSHNIDRNTKYNDVVVAYSSNGQVYVSVYNDVLKSISITDPTPSIELCGSANFDLTFSLTGNFDPNTDFSVVLSDASGSFENNTILEKVITNIDTTLTVSLPADLPASNSYRILIESESDCTQSQPINLIVGAIEFFDPIDLNLCVDSTGIGVFDLAQNTSIVVPGEKDTAVTYHNSQNDAINSKNPITDISNYISASTTIWLRYENTDADACSVVTDFKIIAASKPTVNAPISLVQCDADQDGITKFNLAEANSLVSNNPDYRYTYYTSESSAEVGLAKNQIMDFSTYSNPTPINSEVFVRVENTNGCHTVSKINLKVVSTQIPKSFELTYISCDDTDFGSNTDGVSSFDFSDASSKIEELLPAGQNLNVSFYLNQSDALSEKNPISNISNYRNDLSPSTQMIWVRVDNQDSNACLGLGAHIKLEVNAVPLNNQITDYKLCSDNGQARFDLNTKLTEIIGTQSQSLVVSYHESAEDARNKIAIVDPGAYISAGQMIYVRAFFDKNNNGVEDSDECYSAADMSFELVVLATPSTDPPDPIKVCNNQIDTIYDLTQITNQVTGGDDSIVLTYYQSVADLHDNLPIRKPSEYLSTELNAQIIVNATSSYGCSSQQLLQLQTTLYESYNFMPDILEECELDGDGFDRFDLTRVEADILNLKDKVTPNDLTPDDFNFTYYISENEASRFPENTANAIPSPNMFTNTTKDFQTIYVRIVPTGKPDIECFAVIPVDLFVNTVSKIDIEDEYVICLAKDDTILASETTFLPQPPLNTQLSNDQYTFQWYNGSKQEVFNNSDAYLIPGEIAASFNPIEAGEYTVMVTDLKTSCSFFKSTTVVQSIPPESIEIDLTSTLFSGNNVIEVSVTGNGEYEYQLDNGPWQMSSNFQDVSGGEHTVYVRDLLNCSVLMATKSVIDYPLFFTPNNDGRNDTWHIRDSGNLQNAKVYIYDRYGKLLAGLSNTSAGWDGTYGGNQMPVSDYWFTVEYNEPSDDTKRLFSSHFTLKR